MLRSASVSSYYSDNGTVAFSTANNTARGPEERPLTKPVESAKALALRALKALSKSAVSSLQMDEVPTEILFGESVDLHRWTMILNDKNLQELAEQKLSGKKYFIDTSSGRLLDMFQTFYSPMQVPEGLLNLNIACAKDITDFGLTVVARNSPNLLNLNISGCSPITDVALREVGMSCHKLQVLNISSCPEIDGTGLIAVAESCRQLLKLDISKCRKIENWSIKKIFYYCTVLEEVNVSNMNKIGDEEIRTLAQNCPNLIALHAAECPYISDTSIQTVAQCCRDLDVLDVSRTEMQYRISDAKKYLMQVSDPESSLNHATESALRHVVGSSKMVYILNEGRATIARDVQPRLQKYLDSYNTGLFVTGVNVLEALPPKEVKAAFDDVIRAKEDKERLKNQAETYANGIVPEARGQAARLLAEAEGYKLEVVDRATGDAARFDQLITEYRKAPAVTRSRLYYETMESVLGKTSKVVVDGNNNQMLYLPLDKLMQQNTPAVTPAPAPTPEPAPSVRSRGGNSQETRS